MVDTFNTYVNGAKKDTGIAKPPHKFTGLTPKTKYTLGVSRVAEDGRESTVTTIEHTTLALVIPVETITLAPKNATGTSLEIGEKQFTATIAPTTATDKTVTWAVTPTKAGITVDNKGLVKWTAVGGLAGAYTVKGTSKDGKVFGEATLTLTDKVGV